MYKATNEFKAYRNNVLKLKKEDFRKLQKGKAVKISKELIAKYPALFKEVKHGN